MAEIAQSSPAGPATDDQICAFETYIGHMLPSEYRQFLLQHNGGCPEPDAFLLNTDRGEEENAVLCFFPLRELDLGDVSVEDVDGLRTWPLHCAWDDLRNDIEDLYSAGTEDPLLPIGTDGSGNYVCTVLDGARAGSVVFLDHETGETHLLAAGFTAFLGSLRPRERTEVESAGGPQTPDTTYARIGALVTAGACVQCGGSGRCYCIRKGPGHPTGCSRCHGSGQCVACQGSGKARR